jgi:hypothetical protein
MNAGTLWRLSFACAWCAGCVLSAGRQVFFDMTGAAGEDATDGIKVDQRGNVYVSGPSGLSGIRP